MTLLLALLTASVSAEPIGMITVKSAEDARLAGATVGEAFARVGNEYLVAADSSQQYRLARNGIEFEPVLGGVDASSVYCIYRMDHPGAPTLVDPGRLGTVQNLGGGLEVADLSRAAAASLSESGTQAIPLADRTIPITYRGPSIVALAEAEDFPVDYLADLVDQDSIYAYDQHLQDFVTRYTYTESCLDARDWIKEKFLSWGYTVVDTQRFYYNSHYHYNVYAIKPGTVHEDQYILVGGHYDSYNTNAPGPYEYAPGADDNGSGTTLTLELARVLADVPLRKSVIFMAFGAEEVGLVGSAEAADRYSNYGTQLEVMMNYDMVGFTDDALWDVDLSCGDVTAYRELSAQTAVRVTSLTPTVTYLGSSSDHYPFYQEGFSIVNNIESDFNWDGWHTNLDLTSRMNFPYLTEVVKMALVSAAIVAESPYPTNVDEVLDVGDGQSLQVAWDGCESDCSYTVFWGTSSGAYTDSATVPAGQCGYTINGIESGTEYYVLALGNTPSGYRAIQGTEGRGTPFLYPLSPDGVVGDVDPDLLRLKVSWEANHELDLSHYNVYRRVSDVGVFQLLQEGVTATQFYDIDVEPHVQYFYRVTAVDQTGYESEPSPEVAMYPATFDGGPVLVDAFSKVNGSEPEQAEQEAWFDSLFDGVGYSLAQADEFHASVTLGDVGRFSTMFWIDDDIVDKDMTSSGPALTDFATHQTDMMIAGWKSWYDWVGSPVPSYHIINSEFRVTAYEYTGVWDFIGAHGQDGWPSVAIDPARGPDNFRDVAKLTPGSGAEVIYTFHSQHGYVDYEGQPVGLAYNGAHGKRVILAFPLYYLDQESARALVAKVVEYFETEVTPQPGDLDLSGTVEMADLVILLDHLFMSMTPLERPDLADVDGRAGLSIGDAWVLINYLFGDGPAPTQ